MSSTFEDVYVDLLNVYECGLEKIAKAVKVVKLELEDSSSLIMIDLRNFIDSRPTKKGVCLRINEFNDLMALLKDQIYEPIKPTKRNFQIKMLENGHVVLSITLGDIIKKYTLDTADVSQLLKKEEEIRKAVQSVRKTGPIDEKIQELMKLKNF